MRCVHGTHYARLGPLCVEISGCDLLRASSMFSDLYVVTVRLMLKGELRPSGLVSLMGIRRPREYVKLVAG